MNHRYANILSIGINRQRVGIAVFTNGELAYITGRALPAVMSLSGRRKLIAYIDDLVRQHEIKIVTMPRLTVQQQNSRAVIRIYKRIQTRTIRGGLTLTIESLPAGRSGRVETDEDLAALYPELRRFLGNAAWERRYYKHIFKAVSAGVARLRINEEQRRSNE